MTGDDIVEDVRSLLYLDAGTEKEAGILMSPSQGFMQKWLPGACERQQTDNDHETMDHAPLSAQYHININKQAGTWTETRRKNKINKCGA